MTDLSQRQMEAAAAAGIREVLQDKDTLMVLLGDVVRSIVKEEQGIKWDRACGIDCTDYESVREFRSHIDFLRELHQQAMTDEGKRIRKTLEQLAKLDDPDILADVANIATQTKEKIIRVFVLAAFALFFAAAGWSIHHIDPRKLLE